MKLSEYLEAQGLSYAAFARLIGTGPETVRRYALGERWPRKDQMEDIMAATGFRVTANDFVGVAKVNRSIAGHLTDD